MKKSKIKFELMSEEQFYAVACEEKEYTLQFNKDHNTGSYEIIIYDENGDKIENEIVKDAFIKKFSRSLRKML